MGAKNSKRTSIDEDIRTTRVAPQRRDSTRCLQFSWKLLWENRVFSSTEDIAILPRHIEEAKLDFTNQVAEDQEERVCNRTVTIRSTIL